MIPRVTGPIPKSMKLDTTSVLAIWGAILSSITFAWNLFRDLRDRPRVRLKGTLGQLVTDTVGRLHFGSMKFIERLTDKDPNEPTQLKLTITNTGRRRVRIEGWAGIRGRGMPKASHISRGLPKILEEGEFRFLILSLMPSRLRADHGSFTFASICLLQVTRPAHLEETQMATIDQVQPQGRYPSPRVS